MVDTKTCPECLSDVLAEANRCRHCAADLSPAAQCSTCNARMYVDTRARYSPIAWTGVAVMLVALVYAVGLMAGKFELLPIFESTPWSDSLRRVVYVDVHALLVLGALLLIAGRSTAQIARCTNCVGTKPHRGRG